MPIPLFRTLGDEVTTKPSPNLLETIYLMQQRQAWMREFLTKEGENQLPFVKTTKIDERPTLIAERIRYILKLEEGWAAHQATWTDALSILRDSIENAGIIVSVSGIVKNNTYRNLDPDEFRGFVLVDEYAPLVFVNGADGKAAQMFTLAHELAHILFGSSAAFDLRGMQPANDPIERACDQVAAEFLVPESKLRHFWLSLTNIQEKFQLIARHFKVSELVAARRAKDLALITKETFFKFYENYKQTERSTTKKEGGNYYFNKRLQLGQYFGSVVVRAAKEGKIHYSEAFRLTGLYGKTFDKFADSLGI